VQNERPAEETSAGVVKQACKRDHPAMLRHLMLRTIEAAAETCYWGTEQFACFGARLFLASVEQELSIPHTV
jgi:hypothetical protein